MTDQKKARKAWARWEQTYRLLRRQVTSSSREFRSSMWAGYHEKLQNVFATLVKVSSLQFHIISLRQTNLFHMPVHVQRLAMKETRSVPQRKPNFCELTKGFVTKFVKR